MKKLILLLFFAVLFVGIAKACICEEQMQEERIEKSHFIFTGKVISVEEVFTESISNWPVVQRIVIEVEKKFKGNQSDRIIVESELSTCASFFEQGKKYLVFAGHYITNETEINQNFIDTNNKIVTHKCTGTREIENSKNEIRLLEKLFSSGLSIKDISADKLYNEIWKDETFLITDEFLEFPGGGDSLTAFIKKHLRACTLQKKEWAKEQKDDSLYVGLNNDFEQSETNSVWVNFDVSKTGKLSNFSVNSYFSLNEECNNEALRVAKLMPDWKPGTIKGIPVNTTHFIEIEFN